MPNSGCVLQVITATEYFTESSVHQPSIVQTLPVHITITETRTRGLDGQYTLFDLTHGATSVIHEPITTPTFDLDSTGLDLANLDLSQLDLTSLSGGLASLDGDQGQVLAMLSSLLAGGDDTGGSSAPAGGNRNFRNNAARNKNQKVSRFSPEFAEYEDPVEETPKYNVLRGFTLSDRVASVAAGPPTTGRAATDTRYSKYHRKTRPDNNGISTTESSSPREAERFSASTRRRTLSRTTDRRRSTPSSRPPSTRFVAAPETQYYEEDAAKFRQFGQRQDRDIASRRRGSLESRQSPRTPPRARSKPPSPARQENTPTTSNTPQPTGLSTVLTLYISGSEPGQFSTKLQTVQLRSLGSSSRRRRNVDAQPMTKLSTSTVLQPSSFSTVIPQIPPEADPKKVVQMLKQLEPTHVRQMIHSLQKWVDFYSHEVLDEPDNRVVPELTSSLSAETQEPEIGATTALPKAPVILTGLSMATDRCPVPSTVTTTVYRTVVLTAGINNGESTV